MGIFECCNAAQWQEVHDMGHARSFDFILGTCTGCGSYWANLYCIATASTSYERVSPEEATKLLELASQDRAALKIELKNWIDTKL